MVTGAFAGPLAMDGVTVSWTCAAAAPACSASASAHARPM